MLTLWGNNSLKSKGTKKYMNVNERVTRTTRARATIKKTLRNIYTELSFQKSTFIDSYSFSKLKFRIGVN